jgi:ubiquinone/menaquinone biosynthesis C-methylase UbiE
MSDHQNKIEEVIKANIALHSQMADDYNTCEPHFRIENIQNVEDKLLKALESGDKKRALDLGCGTGFMINLLKKHVNHVTGVDVTQAMMDKVDMSGACDIELINNDTGSVDITESSYDVVTAYSFLHHLYDVRPTLETAFNALKPGAIFYADLDPNFYFWEQINKLDRHGEFDPIIKREIEAVSFKDEDIEANFGVAKEVFNNAEFGKNIKGGFKEDELVAQLKEIGFSEVKFFYHWYIGQGHLINRDDEEPSTLSTYANEMDKVLQKIAPLSNSLYKYVGFYATK